MSLAQLLFSSQGRIPRSTYWIYGICFSIVQSIAFLVDVAFDSFSESTGLGAAGIIVILLCFIPNLMVSIKRCHDRDRSGWFILISAIPIINFWFLIEICFLRGTVGTNQYGPDPLGPARSKREMSNPQYDYGPYTNLDDDLFRSDSYGSRENNVSDFLAAEKQPAQNEIFGMLPLEIAILGILLVVICVFGSFVGLRFLSTSNPEPVAVVHLPTATMVPTTTPTPTVTPVVKSTPLPGWSQFTFDDGNAEIWLPSSYQGGDTVAYPEIVAMTIDTYIADEIVVEAYKEMITDPLMHFFAFDTQPAAFPRFMYVSSEKIPADVIFHMDDYLDMTIRQLKDKGRGTQIINHYLTSLDYYTDTGILLAEDTIPTEDGGSRIILTLVSAIQVEDRVWVIVFVVDGDDFDELMPMMKNSALSFYWQP